VSNACCSHHFVVTVSCLQIESGTIEQLLNSDPARIRSRLKHERKQLSKTAGMAGLSSQERLKLVIDDEEQIDQEITVIKRVFAKSVAERWTTSG
jgi:hypothetical protein